MKKKQIRVSFERLVNLGNYENTKLMAESLIDLDENDNVDEAYAEGWKDVVGQVNKLAEALIKRRDGVSEEIHTEDEE